MDEQDMKILQDLMLFQLADDRYREGSGKAHFPFKIKSIHVKASNQSIE